MERVKIEKNRDYTILSNIGLRDKNLSLKAKGFYAVIFSLSDDWDFSINGICTILKESKTAVYSVIKELQQYGYCKIERCKDEKGKFIGVDYSFIESPHSDYPQTGFPQMDNPQMEDVPQLNTDSKEEKTKLTSSAEAEVVGGDLFVNDSNADTQEANEIPPRNNNVTKVTPEEFVEMYHEKCPTLPKILKLTQKRKDAITRRMTEMGDKETIESVLDRLSKSDFCRGVNQSKWKADFDWLVKNDTIWVWILEGKYDNKGATFTPIFNAPQQAPTTEITNF